MKALATKSQNPSFTFFLVLRLSGDKSLSNILTMTKMIVWPQFKITIIELEKSSSFQNTLDT